MMKKNLLMLLCAVSLLAHTVHADGTAVAGTSIPEAESGRIATFWKNAKAGVNDVYGDHWFGVTPSEMTMSEVQNLLYPGGSYENLHPQDKRLDKVNDDVAAFMRAGKYEIPFYKRSLTGRVPKAASQILRSVNLLNALDLAVRDKDALAARLIARLGKKAGFYKGNGWRGRVADIVGNDSKLARASRTAAALLLAGALDKAFAYPVDSSSLVGSGYRGIKDLFTPRPVFGPKTKALEDLASAHAANDAFIGADDILGGDPDFAPEPDYVAPSMEDFLKTAEARGTQWRSATDKRTKEIHAAEAKEQADLDAAKAVIDQLKEIHAAEAKEQADLDAAKKAVIDQLKEIRAAKIKSIEKELKRMMNIKKQETLGLHKRKRRKELLVKLTNSMKS